MLTLVPVLKGMRAGVSETSSASFVCGPEMALGLRPRGPCSHNQGWEKAVPEPGPGTHLCLSPESSCDRGGGRAFAPGCLQCPLRQRGVLSWALGGGRSRGNMKVPVPGTASTTVLITYRVMCTLIFSI